MTQILHVNLTKISNAFTSKGNLDHLKVLSIMGSLLLWFEWQEKHEKVRNDFRFWSLKRPLDVVREWWQSSCSWVGRLRFGFHCWMQTAIKNAFGAQSSSWSPLRLWRMSFFHKHKQIPAKIFGKATCLYSIVRDNSVSDPSLTHMRLKDPNRLFFCLLD